MMKLRINPIVAEDLKNIKEYIAEDNEEMAVKTIQEIYARFENIQQFPYMGADLAKRVSFRTDYKYVICGNYVVLIAKRFRPVGKVLGLAIGSPPGEGCVYPPFNALTIEVNSLSGLSKRALL